MITLVGAGAWGKNLFRNLHELSLLHSVVDPAPQARELAEQNGVPHFDDIAQVLDNPEIKGVAVATSAPTHFAVCMAALDAGKDVFVEKPIALQLSDAQAMAEKANEKNAILMVGHLLQYHPCFAALRDLVAKGELGNVRYVLSTRLNFGRIRSNEDVIWSFSPHDISMVLSLIDAPVSDVSSHGFDILQDGIADIGHITLNFANGASAEIRSSWLHPLKEQRLVVVGQSKMAVFDDRLPWEEKLTIYDHHVAEGPVAAPGEAHAVDVPFGEPLKLELQHFADRIDDRQPPISDPAEAIAVLNVLQQASSLEG